MHISIALPVGMADHIHRDAIDGNGEIRAVIRIEAAEQNLVGFAAAMMLADDQPRHQAQNVARRIRSAEAPGLSPLRVCSVAAEVGC